MNLCICMDVQPSHLAHPHATPHNTIQYVGLGLLADGRADGQHHAAARQDAADVVGAAHALARGLCRLRLRLCVLHCAAQGRMMKRGGWDWAHPFQHHIRRSIDRQQEAAGAAAAAALLLTVGYVCNRKGQLVGWGWWHGTARHSTAHAELGEQETQCMLEVACLFSKFMWEAASMYVHDPMSR